MSLHAARRYRLLLVLAAVAALAGCTRSENASGSPRVISPGMSESSGTPLLFQESRAYLWADNR